MEYKYIAVFESSRDVIKCDKQCKLKELDSRIVPVPEKYSNNCGMSIEFIDKTHFEEIITEIRVKAKIYDK